MAKRKRKKQRKSPFSGIFPWQRNADVDLQTALAQADDMIAAGNAQGAIALLEPLLSIHSNQADLHYYLGYAHAKAGDAWGALSGYEWALDLSKDSDYWLPLAALYLQVELRASALRAHRQVIKHRLDTPDMNEIRLIIEMLEVEVAETAKQLNLSTKQTEQGLRFMEQGQQALHGGEYKDCIKFNQKAIKLLGNWPPPRNNLSMALFYNGQPQEAIDESRQVLANEADNLQALSNIIRYVAWTESEDEARAFWPQLRDITPQGNSDRLKKMEAAAILGEDEAVYELLLPLEEASAGPDRTSGSRHQTHLFMAIAEANTNRQRSAKRRLKKLKKHFPWTGKLLSALHSGKAGPGYSKRYPYFHSAELLPRARMEEFIALFGKHDTMPEKKFRQKMGDFAARFPQIVLAAEKFIWEEDQPEAGIGILGAIGTPAAHAALRRFGTSQTGDDQIRMQAIMELSKTGKLSDDKPLRIWREGKWEDILIRAYEINDEADEDYTPEEWDMLEQATETSKRKGQVEKAISLFQQLIAKNPNIKEAYNNLATIYAKRSESEKAKEMLYAALEIDPLYVFPRANLANYLVSDGDIEGAEEMLKPLADLTRFHSQEMSIYMYTQARIAVEKGELEQARAALKMALDINPDYEQAHNLLQHLEENAERLEMFSAVRKNFASFQKQQQKRNQTKRAKLQTKLTTPKPTLTEALSLYTKDSLTGMAREVIMWGGWSGLRKADLIQRIIESLSDEDALKYAIEPLTDKERDALRQILANDGKISWADFNARYDNDLEESPYWQFHVPDTMMGRLRLRGLLVEATVDANLLLVMPTELRPLLTEILG
ncbi:MAG TPA: tetratricopeptide repeat protein [Chloroflexi bacterium]|nr:tetratricopeptide repeat protein [Chloroflexota bacterium]